MTHFVSNFLLLCSASTGASLTSVGLADGSGQRPSWAAHISSEITTGGSLKSGGLGDGFGAWSRLDAGEVDGEVLGVAKDVGVGGEDLEGLGGGHDVGAEDMRARHASPVPRSRGDVCMDRDLPYSSARLKLELSCRTPGPRRGSLAPHLRGGDRVVAKVRTESHTCLGFPALPCNPHGLQADPIDLVRRGLVEAVWAPTCVGVTGSWRRFGPSRIRAWAFRHFHAIRMGFKLILQISYAGASSRQSGPPPAWGRQGRGEGSDRVAYVLGFSGTSMQSAIAKRVTTCGVGAASRRGRSQRRPAGAPPAPEQRARYSRRSAQTTLPHRTRCRA